MKVQEIKQILSRNSQSDELESLSSLIENTVNFGTHLLYWEIEKNNSEKESIVYQTFFKNILELTDGISILVKNSSMHNTKLLFRVLIESILSLEYLLESDSKNRAFAYIITTVHKEISSFEKLDLRIQKGKEFITKLKKDKIFEKVPFINIRDSGNSRENLIAILQTPDLINIENEYQNLASKKKNPNWFSLFGGPNNIEELASYLHHHTMYETYYRNFSEDIHVSNLLKNSAAHDNNQLSVGIMRENEDAKFLSLSILTYLVGSYFNFIQKRVPEKSEIFEKWHLDFSITFENVNNSNPVTNSDVAQ